MILLRQKVQMQLIFSLSAIFTGILFGVAFLSVARTLTNWYCRQELYDNC